jgi:uncharacterized protein YihD (DUF1040 family)
MIIPATVFRIVGFINKEKDSIEETPQEGGLVFCYSDQGNPLVLQMTSNKKDLSLEDIKRYLDNKRDSVIKQKEIDAVAGELEYLEDFEVELEDALEKFKEENGNDRKAIIKFKKDYKNIAATELVKKRRTIGKNSIIRTVIDLPDGKTKKITFKGKEFNFLRSRCIIFDNEGNPSTSGLYFYAQTANTLPISIKPIFNKEGESLNLFTISLSKISSLEHFEHITDHIIRSVARFVEKKEKAYLPNITYDYEKIKNTDLYKIVKKIIEITKKKEVTYQEADKFIGYILELKDFILKNPKHSLNIQYVFNLLLTPTFIEESISKNTSPFSKLKDTFVNLNFSKEDPDKKNDKKEIVKQYIEDLKNGNIRGEIIGTYHTPALKLSEPSDSWGFMTNNVQLDSFILSSIDTLKLYKKIS